MEDSRTTTFTQPTIKAGGEAPAWPALTILSHASVRRVGDVVRLGPGLHEIGRNAPYFASTREPVGEPLGDRGMSRQPVTLRVEDDRSVVIDRAGSRSTLVVDGVETDGPLRLDPGRVREGVTVELAGRLLLLLHLATADALGGGDLGLVGESDAVRRLRREIRQVADLDVPVLLRGESGVGKELVARALHLNSSRSKGPFEAVNMAAIAPSLAASELFGHARGAFSGADRKHAGCFERAHGGTLFLDEVGDTPSDVQPMLLRTLETGEVMGVGASSAQRVDVRVVSATDADLDGGVERGAFRAPLLHRLAGFQIKVPPLRERREDIGRLFYHFVRGELERLGDLPRLTAESAFPWVPVELVGILARYRWPGNVRQLRNVARQLVIASRGAERMVYERLLPELLPGREERPAPSPDDTAPPASPTPVHKSYRSPQEVSEEELVETLRRFQWRLAPAAEALGLSRTAMYHRVEASARVRKAAEIPEAEVRETLAAHPGLADAAASLEVSEHALKIRMRALRIS